MRGEQEAIEKIPPGEPGSSDVGAPTAITLSAASTAAVALPNMPGNNMGGAWYTFNSDVDCFVNLGPSGVGAAVAATSWPVWAKQPTDYWCNPVTKSHVRAIAGGAGLLKVYRSNG